ncbi:MAG: amidase [Streptosporangiaceae bacterium]|jgi:amidase|nr:amidase [Actinomycetota bacterium]
MTEPHDLTALEQAAAIRRGELSPAELAEHYLARISRLNPSLGAFITVTPELALARAKAHAQAAAARLRNGPDGLPPLLGVPVAIKDLTATAGIRTTYGSRAFASHVPDTDAHSVTLLRAAGTVSLGKTSTPEFGTCCYTDNDLTGPTRSPWDPRCSAGGSSGGSAAAVAAGLVPFAHGSDGGGSVRIPASVCGLVGLKPSRGRVSSGPADGDSPGLSIQGPLARTVRDAAAMLDAIAVSMPGDPYWAPPLPAGQTFLGWADQGHAGQAPGRLRIGRYRAAANGTAADPACIAAWEDASQLLASLGHEVEDIELPFGPEMPGYFATIWGVKSLDTQVGPDQEMQLRPVTRAWREHGRTISGAAYAAAVTGMQVAARRSIVATAGYDAVLTPTLGLPPQPVGYFSEDGEPLDNLRRQGVFTPFTPMYNMTGQPAVSLPLHWTGDGVPIGVSLAGRPAGEAALIALSAQLEAARPWAWRHPACW